jgi:hypothetical protein
MSLPDQGQTSQACPRCKIILPINQIACYNCGLHFATVQPGDALRNTSIPPSPAGRSPSSLGISKLRGSPSSLPGISQFKGGPSSLPGISSFNGGAPSSLGLSQFRGGLLSSLGSSPLAGGETPALGVPRTPNGQPVSWEAQVTGGETPALGVPRTPNGQPVSWEAQATRGETPALGVPRTSNGQPITWGVQIAGGATPALAVPQNAARPLSSPEKAPAPALSKPAVARKARAEKDQSPAQKRATLIYLTTVVFVIVVVAFAGLRAAGISLTSLTSHKGTNSAVAYPLPKAVPLFADSFLNDASGWNLQSSRGNYAVNVSNGTLTMQVNKNKLLWEPLPGTISYGDFTLTVNAVLAKGDQNNGYGVYIRGAASPGSDLTTYYRFELYGDGSYAIFKGIVDQNGNSTATKIVNYTLNSAIQKQGKTNHIMILAQGASLSFIVNDQLLKTFTDASYATGSIALFASNLPEAKPGMQVQFSLLAIYPLHMSRSA